MEENLSQWLTIEEFAKATNKGQRTIERLITKQLITVAKHRREEGRKPITVIDPKEIPKVAAQPLRPVVQSASTPPRQTDTLPANAPTRQLDVAGMMKMLERLQIPLRDKLYLTRREAALYLGFPESEVEREISAKAIPTTRLSNGWLRIAREDLDRYYQARRQQVARWQNGAMEGLDEIRN